jgi:hypothetical protein
MGGTAADGRHTRDVVGQPFGGDHPARDEKQWYCDIVMELGLLACEGRGLMAVLYFSASVESLTAGNACVRQIKRVIKSAPVPRGITSSWRRPLSWRCAVHASHSRTADAWSRCRAINRPGEAVVVSRRPKKGSRQSGGFGCLEQRAMFDILGNVGVEEMSGS